MSDDRRELADRLNRAARRAYDPRNAQTILQAATAIRDLAAECGAAVAQLQREQMERSDAETQLTAALARAEAAEAAARILAQGELDMTVRAVTAEAEAQRLREGIERHRHRHDIGLTYHHPRPMDEALWALLAEQPETKA